jgi:UDP-N-acetylglucosamine 2-epimerase
MNTTIKITQKAYEQIKTNKPEGTTTAQYLDQILATIPTKEQQATQTATNLYNMTQATNQIEELKQSNAQLMNHITSLERIMTKVLTRLEQLDNR